ncbi:heme exporter protein CcmD [Luteimonas terrae]|uniref:Heme exporter protein D n=1 Tax=Luteimonas terrae TaxID=1530191 RepID=A0ABU1XWD0_9GAMM|nr:heme exporter protein CcmD [Luteimonas terrae]MDR7193068.1 heme exporter protein D [Luteimonas terrae]
MTYIEYVVAAYAVFAAVLAWDFVAPRIRTAHLLRAVRLVAARRAAAITVAADDAAELRR